jgi:hypothetical protein
LTLDTGAGLSTIRPKLKDKDEVNGRWSVSAK